MKPVALDLIVYPPAEVRQGMIAYRDLASFVLGEERDNHALLEVTSLGQYDETRIIDEFLNYLIALAVKHHAET